MEDSFLLVILLSGSVIDKASCNWQSSVWELPLLAFQLHFKWFPFIDVHKLSDTKTGNKEQRIEQTFLQQKYTDGRWAYKKCSTLLVTESESRSVVSDSLRPHGLYSPWNSPGQNTGVGSLSLLQGVFPTQGSNPGLPQCRWLLYQLSHREAQESWSGEAITREKRHRRHHEMSVRVLFSRVPLLRPRECQASCLSFFVFSFFHLFLLVGGFPVFHCLLEFA